MKTAAFFDLDGTLLCVNSGSLWVKRELRVGRIGFRQYVEAMLYLLAYRLHSVDMAAAMRKALATVRGEREDVVRAWTRRWYSEEVASLVAPGAWRALSYHRQAGHLLVLLTTNSCYEAEIATEHMQLDAWISSRYEVHEGVFTGEPLMPLCYGEGKVARAECFAQRRGVDLDRSFFYSDSASDTPMLRRVGFPRVVNPDLRLRLRARREGWPVLNWRR